MMKSRIVTACVAAALVSCVTAERAAAQSDHTHVGIGVVAGTQGIGAQVAVPVATWINVRGAASGLSLSHDFSGDVPVAATLTLSGVDAHVDMFPFHGGFHVSPGLTIHNGTKVDGTVSLPAGKKFTLNDVDYVSAASSPVTGTANVSFKETGPSLLIGWGNLVPRGERRWSVQFEAGAIFSKQPTFAMALAGAACPAAAANCAAPLNVASDPTVQSNLKQQIKKVNDDLEPFKAFPVMSIGFGYKF